MTAAERAFKRAEHKARLEKKKLEKTARNASKARASAAAASTSSSAGATVATGTKSRRARGLSLFSPPAPEDVLMHVSFYLPGRDLSALVVAAPAYARLFADHASVDGGGAAPPRPLVVHFRCRVPPAMAPTEADSGAIMIEARRASPGVWWYPAYVNFLDRATGVDAGRGAANADDPMEPPVRMPNRIVSASPVHTILVTSDNPTTLISYGHASRGALGNGTRRNSPLQYSLPATVRIVQVSCGGGLVQCSHSLFLAEGGGVYSCGTGAYGQLGTGYGPGRTLPDHVAPVQVDFDSDDGEVVRCTYVSAGEIHSAAITSDGDLYCWGDGFCGQLGTADKRPRVSPVHVTANEFCDEVVSSVSCGGRHTIAIAEDGKVWTWGLGHYGALGRSYTPFEYGTTDDAVAPVPLPYAGVGKEGQTVQDHIDLLARLTLEDGSDQCIPVPVRALGDVRIASAAAGHRHSIFLDTDGAVYTCGWGRYGELGHGDGNGADLPLGVAGLPGDVVAVHAGVDTTLALTGAGKAYAWGRAVCQMAPVGVAPVDGVVTSSVPALLDCPVPVVAAATGYVHTVLVGIGGQVYLGGVMAAGVEGETEAEVVAEGAVAVGNCVGRDTVTLDQDPDWCAPREGEIGIRKIPEWNVCHIMPKNPRVGEEDKDKKKKKRVYEKPYKKYGAYSVKGRSKATAETDKWS